MSDCPPNEEPRAGWGQVIGSYFSDDVKVNNHAVGGRSSNSFIKEGRLEQIVKCLKTGDYLFIQFGHNDQKSFGTEPYSTYQSYLAQYIDGAREKGATPILITPMHRRTFDDKGKIVNSLGDYPKAMIDLAKETNVLIIDLWGKSKLLYESLGPKACKKLFIWFEPDEQSNYPEGIRDDTHFCEEGAILLADIIVTAVKEYIPELSRFLEIRKGDMN